MTFYISTVTDEDGIHAYYYDKQHTGSIEATSLEAFRNISTDLVSIEPWGALPFTVECDGDDINNVFKNLEKLESIDFTGFEFTKKQSLINMFTGCNSLQKVKGLKIEQTSVTQMFGSITSTNLNLEDCEFYGNNLNQMLQYASVHVFTFTNCKATQVSTLNNFASNNAELTRCILDDFEITPANYEGSETPVTVDCGAMFAKCPKLTIVSGGVNFKASFSGCFEDSGNSEGRLTVRNWTIGDSSSISTLFRYVTSLELDCSLIQWPLVAEPDFFGGSLARTFGNMPNCTTIYCNDLKGKISPDSGSYTFEYSEKLIGGNGTEYSSSHYGIDYAVIDTDDTPGYFTTPKKIRYITVSLNPSAGGQYSVTEDGMSATVVVTMNGRYNWGGYQLTAGGEHGISVFSKKADIVGQQATFTITYSSAIEGEYAVVVKLLYKGDPYTPYDPDKPYDPDDPTTWPTVTPGDITSDIITDDKPGGDFMSYSDSEFTEIFIPTQAQLKQFATAIQDPTIFSDDQSFWFRLFGGDYMDLVAGFRVVPVTVPVSGSKKIKYGSFVKSAVTMNYTKKNYVEMDFGALKIDPFYNNYLDYRTNIQLYIPFLGYVPLENYDVIGKTLRLTAQIDLLSAQACYKLFVDGSIKYQWMGNAGYELPISSTDGNKILMKPLGTLAQIAIGSVGSSGVTTTQITENTKINYSKKGIEQGTFEPTSRKHEAIETTTHEPSTAHQGRELIGAFDNMGTGVVRGSGLNGNGGFLSTNTPYLVLTYPNWNVPANYGGMNGFPCNKYLKLGTLSGYTEVEAIHLHNIQCTQQELDEIDTLLKGGVIL